MAGNVSNCERPREWRRRVLVPARMRLPGGWGDARILNVSSRGLMIHASHSTRLGDMIELRRGSQVIVARVVWKQGPRSGLQSDQILPLIELLSHNEGKERDEPVPDRRTKPRHRGADIAARAQLQAKILEYGSIATIAICIALSIGTIASDVLGTNLDLIGAALTN